MTDRKTLTKKRRTLTVRQRQYSATRAALSLPKLLRLLPKNAKIGIYADDFGELPTHPLVRWCVRHGHTPYLPVVFGRQLRFAPIFPKNSGRYYQYSLAKKRHRLGMNEPVSKKHLVAKALDACFCPLVAVSKAGVRTGMGGGFYDYTLADFKGIKVGWCYSFQVTDSLPKNPWDVRMDWVLSDKGSFKT